MADPPYHFRPAAAAEIPLLVSIPHTGTAMPAEIAARFATPAVAALPDTDWHLHDLYAFAPELGAATLFAHWSRYVVDLNRAPDRARLYPGRDETTLVPTSTFAGEPIYAPGRAPDEAEAAARTERFWRPYHDRLAAELARLRERFGYALLLDAHSIVSRVPRFHDGELPGFMLGDADGTSAGPALSAAVHRALAASGHRTEVNFVFKGGYITRRYGRPAERVHALQLEMAQRLYMQEGSPYAYREDLAAELARVLRAALLAFAAAAR
jgi:N-formylglutamate deformylase